MSWNQGSYGVQHRGATGGYAGPARLTQGLVGANRPTDGLSVRPLAPVHSLAASLPPESLAAIASDKPHSSVLDGHAGSAVANHPDGLFAANTAATSDHSLHANFDLLNQDPLAGTYLQLDRTLDTTSGQLLGDPTREISGKVGYSFLAKDRLLNNPGAEQPEAIVKGALAGPRRVLSALSREYSGHELALGALGLYAAYSVVARA